jgi:hypothetical protein
MPTLPLDDAGVPTSAQLVDPATYTPGSSEWAQINITADGGDKTQGAQADAAVTNVANPGSTIALLKGVITHLATMIASLASLVTQGTAGTQTNATSTALEQTRVIKATPGTLFGAQGYSDATGFVVIGDKTSALSGSSDNFKIIVPVEAGKPWSVDLGSSGRAFANGISIGFSTTGPTWTAGGSHIWVDAQYS